MQYRPLPPAEYLRDLFSYDPIEGLLRWKPRPFKRSVLFEGKPAGRVNSSGHREIKLNKVPFYAHRLIWKMMTGYDPVVQIDHKNNNHDDNRWDNLREATQSNQRCNQGLRRSNKSGVVGAYWNEKRGKWQVDVCFNRKKTTLGRFNTKEEAAEVYRQFAKTNHGEFIHPVVETAPDNS